jgi:hypothetical protein
MTQNPRRLVGGLDRSERDMPRRGEARGGRTESTGEDPTAGTMRPDRKHHGRRRSRSPQGESCDDPLDESKILLHPHEHPELLIEAAASTLRAAH